MHAKILLVGGFLGAGKTSLLFEAARKLTEMGQHVGLITNDQAPELVDTTFLQYSKGAVTEVSGSCFCCNYNGFTDAIVHLIEDQQADIIIAEPVGSCTDLSATLIQPLKNNFGKRLVIAPLTVLIDPGRLSDILNGDNSSLHSSAAYIVRKQLEEADIIVISKTDLLTADEVEELKMRSAKEWHDAAILSMSSRSGEGLETWLGEATHRTDSGTHLVEMDYDIYAEGEAVLGWLNATLKLKGEAVDWDKLAQDLLSSLSSRFDESGSAVGHVKLIVEAGNDFVIGNLTGKRDSLDIRRTAGIGNEAKMKLNVRVQMKPENLEAAILEVLAGVCGADITSEICSLQCLSPGRPNPTHRYSYVVNQ